MPIHRKKPSIQSQDSVLMKRFPYLARENLEINIFKKLRVIYYYLEILLLRNLEADTRILQSLE